MTTNKAGWPKSIEILETAAETAMPWLQRLRWRLAVLLRETGPREIWTRKSKVTLEREIRENTGGGVSPEEARRKALVASAASNRTKERVRDIRGARWLDDFRQDLRYAGAEAGPEPGLLRWP